MDYDQIQRISKLLRITRDYIRAMQAYADRRPHLKHWMMLDDELQKCIVYERPLRVLEAVVEDFARICRMELSIVQWDDDEDPGNCSYE